MLASPEFIPLEYMDRQPPNSYIRILHASPDAPSVDVYADTMLIARSLPYRGFTQYLPIPPRSYNIRIFAAGQTTNPVLVQNLTIPPRSITTVAAINRLSSLGLLAIPDTPMPITPGRVMLRFVHLSPNAPNVDVALPDGTILFGDVSYREIMDYIPVRPGRHTFYIRAAGTNQNVLYVPNIQLRPNRFYTIYAVGLAGGSPPLQVLIPLDGNSYITV